MSACGIPYASGMVERLCDRKPGHAGPCSGDYAGKLEAYEEAMFRARGALLDGMGDEATDGERLSALVKAHRILAEAVR